MDALLSRLERRFGKFAIPNLTTFVVAGMAVTFALMFVRPEIVSAMALDPRAVRAGQVWRLLSYVFVPSGGNPLFILFQLSFTWFIGRTLESEWGSFKLNVYYLLGMLGTTAAAFLGGEPVDNVYLNASVFLAFATLYPNYEIRMYLVLPVRVKWLGMLMAGGLVLSAVLGSWGARIGLVASLSNYLLFFGKHLVDLVRQRRTLAAQATRRASMRPGPVTSSAAAAASTDRTCTACGAKASEGADIRVCSCAKCGVPTTFCVEHARSH